MNATQSRSSPSLLNFTSLSRSTWSLRMDSLRMFSSTFKFYTRELEAAKSLLLSKLRLELVPKDNKPEVKLPTLPKMEKTKSLCSLPSKAKKVSNRLPIPSTASTSTSRSAETPRLLSQYSSCLSNSVFTSAMLSSLMKPSVRSNTLLWVKPSFLKSLILSLATVTLKSHSASRSP